MYVLSTVNEYIDYTLVEIYQHFESQIKNFCVYDIKTHGSESRGQEEAGLRDEPVSYLQVAPL